MIVAEKEIPEGYIDFIEWLGPNCTSFVDHFANRSRVYAELVSADEFTLNTTNNENKVHKE